ncbi:receptor-like protein 7 [Cryptomeria japonica]|uniref:receptor-like protein 7 n=1 Tax=Cryptomeria japonica TaxID=3369 RepID=UPI0027DA5B80|nr:receptor-like protein 7 [Cryptomeria japonica]
MGPIIKVFGYHVSTQKSDVGGIRRDESHELRVLLQNQDIYGLNILALQNPTILQQLNSFSGDLIWLRFSRSKDTSNHSALSWSCLRNIPSTLLLISLRVLEFHGVSPQDFCNLFDDREPPLQLRALEVAFNRDFGSASTSTAGTLTVIHSKHGSTSEISEILETSESLQPPINIGPWLEKLNFKNLVKIILQNIPGLETLPIKFEEVRNLRHVLFQLQYLALRDCRKLVLQDLGKISTLEYLDFQGCSMLGEMPKGTEVQKSLKHLNVVHTGLRKFPDNLEQLEDLEELHIGSSGLTEMPSSLYNLSSLTDLTLIGCTNLLLIGNSIEKLVNLESFRVHKCGMRALPVTMAWLLTGVDSGNMSLDSSEAQGSIGQSPHPNRPGCLTDLIIRHSHIQEIDIPQAESLFPKLETVDLSYNRLLTKIGRLPDNLISLQLTNCSNLTSLACLSNLARLKVLDISGCGELETLNVEGLKSIQVIRANGCWELRSFQGLDLLEQLSCFQMSVQPSAIRYLALYRYLPRSSHHYAWLDRWKGPIIKVLVDMSPSKSTMYEEFQLNSVSGDLTWLRLDQFEDILNPSLVSLRSLRNILSTLLLKSLRVLELPPSQLRALEVAFNRDFGSASTSTAGPSTVVYSKRLNFRDSRDFRVTGASNKYWSTVVSGGVRKAQFQEFVDLKVLPDSFTEQILQLQYLALRDCRKLVLQDLGKISTLEYLDFQGCSMLKEMPKGTEVQKSLKHLNVVHTELRELPHNLEQLEDLEELHIGSTGLTEMPSSLCNLSRLTDLTLIGCTNLLLIGNSIEKLVHLESFKIYNCEMIALPVTIAWANIKFLDVLNCLLDLEQLLTGVDPRNMPLDSSEPQGSINQSAHPNRPGRLTDLIIRHSYISEMDIPQAESMFPKLETVDLSYNRFFTKIGRLPNNLISLKLTNCSKLTRLA